MDSNGMMTSAETAEALGISRPWLSRIARRGDIRPVRWAWEGGQYRCWYNALDVRALAMRRREARNGGHAAGLDGAVCVAAPAFMGLGRTYIQRTGRAKRDGER